MSIVKGKILVADDDASFRNLIVKTIQSEGYECLGVTDGFKATEELENNHYDLLIADIKMPGNAQLELVRGLSNIGNNIPVVLVTGYPSIETAMASVKLPVMAYLNKPFDLDELLPVLHQAVRWSSVHRSLQGARTRLIESDIALRSIQESLSRTDEDAFSVPVEAALDITFKNISASLLDAINFAKVLVESTDEANKKSLPLDPRITMLAGVVQETATVLEKTKRAFKSKDLGKLHRRISQVLDEMKSAGL